MVLLRGELVRWRCGILARGGWEVEMALADRQECLSYLLLLHAAFFGDFVFLLLHGG